MSENRFTGTLPEKLSNCSNLMAVYFENIGLEGTIPSAYSQLTNLMALCAAPPTLSGFFGSSYSSGILTETILWDPSPRGSPTYNFYLNCPPFQRVNELLSL